MKPIFLLLFVFQCVHAQHYNPPPLNLPLLKFLPSKGLDRVDLPMMPSQEDEFTAVLATESVDLPAIIVSGGVVATLEIAKDAKNLSLCNYDECKPTSNEVFFDEDTGLAYVKVILDPYLTDALSNGLFEGDEAPDECLSHAFKHKPVKTRPGKNGKVICKRCRNLDGFFCDRLFLGALLRTKPGSYIFDIIPYKSMLFFAENHIINDTLIMREYLEMLGIPPDTEEVTNRDVALRGGEGVPTLDAPIRTATSIIQGMLPMILSILASF